jgi:pyrimidine operon attenuation protein/uracil phosphoribosyltransferase
VSPAARSIEREAQARGRSIEREAQARQGAALNMSLKLNYQLMKAEEVYATLDRIADQILEANNGRPVVLIGIQRRGVPMARRMAVRIAQKTQRQPQIGTLDINLYRDDLTRVASQPVVQKTEVPPNIDDRDVVLVDDVLYTGRTIRAALDALCDFGRMRTIQLAVLIDRGHRELPIEANFTGKKIATKDNEVVEVKLKEVDGEDAIYVMEKI